MNVLSLIETNTQTRNGSKLFRWAERLRTNEGHTVTPIVVPASMPVTDVAARIEGLRPDHVQIWGKVAVPLVYWNPDGHDGRPGSLDCVYATESLDGWGYNAQTGHFEGVNNAWGFWPTAAVRSVSRVYFEDMANIVADPGVAMDAFLDRNHAVRTGAFVYNRRAALVCYLEYLFPGITERIAADLAGIVGGADRVDRLNAPTNEEVYHWFTINQGKTFLAGRLFDGGSSRGGDDGGIGEFNTGNEHDFASGKVQMLEQEIYCSFGWQWNVWAIMRAALVGGSQHVWYNPAGFYPLTGWDEQTPIAKVAQRHHTQYSQQLATGLGDGTLLRPIGVDDDMSQTQIDAINARTDAAIAAAIKPLQDAITALQGATGGGGTGIVINSAQYQQVTNPAVFKDVAAQVRAAWAAGRTLYVYSDQKNADGSWACLNDPSWPDAGGRDPYRGVPKRCVVTGTKDGAPFTVTAGQLDVIARP